MTAHPAGMPPPASLKRPSHVRVADWACVVQLRARRRTVALPPGATARGRKRRLVIASVVHAIRRRAALEAAPHLSRCSDRTYEQHQTNEEATTHHANLLGAAARVR